MKTLKQILANERGVILVISLLILALLIGAGVGAIVSMQTDLNTSSNVKTATEALYFAEAGINETIYLLSIPNTNTNYIGEKPTDSGYPNKGWGRYIVLTTGVNRYQEDPNWNLSADGLDNDLDGTTDEANETYPERATIASGADQLNFRWVKIRYRLEDATFNNGVNNGEVVRYDQTFGYPSPAPATNGDPVIIITAMGKSGNSTRIVQVEVSKKVITVSVDGALQTNDNVDVRGTTRISGFNHVITTVGSDWNNYGTASYITDGLDNNGNGVVDESTGSPRENQISFGARHAASGHKPGIYKRTNCNTSAPEATISVSGTPDRLGQPWCQFFAGTVSIKDPWTMLGITQTEWNDLINNADNTSIVDPLNGVTKITGGTTINSNLTGQGILYVTGNLSGSGDFSFKGLIYVEGDFRPSGGPFLLGSVATKGTGPQDALGTGNPTILYSTEALDLLNNYMKVIVLNWKEIL